MRYLIILILIPLIQFAVSFLGQEFLPAQNSFSVRYIVYFLQQFFAVFVPTYFLFKKESYLNQEECNPNGISNLFRFAILGICLQFLGIFINLPFSMLLQKMGYSVPPSFAPAKNVGQFLIQVFALCLTPAVFEEVLFRRMIFGTIRKKSGIAAIFFSALFFSMAHIDFFNLPATFFIGICLGIMRYRKTPLILCITTHFFVNISASGLNILLAYPAINDFFLRYFLLFMLVIVILFISCFPQKRKQEVLTDTSLKRLGAYTLKLLRNPLFYAYILLFCVLGVHHL